MLNKLFIFLCLLFAFYCANVHGLRQQAVGAKGRLFCGEKPAVNVLVKLFDKDTGKFLIRNAFKFKCQEWTRMMNWTKRGRMPTVFSNWPVTNVR